MFEQTYVSPELKRNLIISNKVVYTSRLMSWRRTSDLGNKEISGKSESFIELLLCAQSWSQI